MVPRRLQDWTLPTIRDMLTAGIVELDCYDWKGGLPDKRNDLEKTDLRKDCAAFANSSGGFLVYGVADSRKMSVEERLTGIDADVDFPRKFGDVVATCEPSIEWRPLMPAIPLREGKVVHVFEIPKSWRAPHSVRVNGAHFFAKRTNKGCESMSLQEVRDSFTRQAEILRRLEALHRNLGHNVQTWKVQKRHMEMEPLQVFIGSSMTVALEAFITNPVFENEISMVEVGYIWQCAQKIDRIADIMATSIVGTKKKGAKENMLSQLDQGIALSEKLMGIIVTIHQRLQPA